MSIYIELVQNCHKTPTTLRSWFLWTCFEYFLASPVFFVYNKRRKETGCMLYELVREIPNLCRNNQMRDVFFDEVETDDPEGYVRSFLKQSQTEMSADKKPDGSVVVFAVADGLTQKFIFTPI